ncbi:MAG TPA: inositol monophosphatase family protein [Ilumatobacter sp.]|nr:inositol monophosphatase family protein [Ilumatobacter sp.]
MSAAPLPLHLELRDLATNIARTAGIAALAGRRSVDTLDRLTKSTPTDLVTKFDRQAEATIVAMLREARPDDTIIGEEGADYGGTSGYAWHVDPIDGTTNFVFDLPGWAVSIGVEFDGSTVAGAVYVPTQNELFAAALGAGATMNDRPITASDQHDVALSLICTGFSYQTEWRKAQGERVARIIAGVRDLRRLGAASVDCCYVACGRLDAYFEENVQSWDIMAGELIAREAGAVSSDFAGNLARPAEFLIAAPGVHAAMLELIGAHSTFAD